MTDAEWEAKVDRWLARQRERRLREVHGWTNGPDPIEWPGRVLRGYGPAGVWVQPHGRRVPLLGERAPRGRQRLDWSDVMPRGRPDRLSSRLPESAPGYEP